MVDKLKAELKRELRSRMTATINSDCVDFDKRVDSDSLQSTVTMKNENGDFDNYYDCCRQFVDYIAKNMETSPDFVEQMNCVILASRTNAPRLMLNAVVKHDVWFHRRSDEMPAPTLGKRKHFQPGGVSKRHRLELPLSLDSDDETLLSTVNTLQEMDVHGLDEEAQDDGLSSMEASKMDKSTGRSDVSIRDFCLLEPHSPGQLVAIQTWIQEFKELCDAHECAPPTGYVCSRGCAEICEHLGNESASDSGRTWQSVQTHLKECQNDQCELRTRVQLRKVMNCIELKQLEICRVRYSLEDKKVSWARAVHYDDESCWLGDDGAYLAQLKQLEKAKTTKKKELVALEGTKALLCARMDSIRLDWRDEEAAYSQDSMQHYKLEVSGLTEAEVSDTSRLGRLQISQ